VAGLLADHGGNITESQQFGDASTGLFFMRVQVEVGESRDRLEESLARLADEFKMTWQLDVVGRRMRTLILVSKAGHCLSDLGYRERSDRLPIEVVGVVSNHRDLEPMVEFYGYPFHHIPVTPETKPAAEARLLELVEERDVELVVLARYMQVLSDDLRSRLEGRVINIHHSLLPRPLRHRRARRAPDHRRGRRAGGPQRRRARDGRAGGGRRAAGAGPRRARARRAPGAARRPAHRRLPLTADRGVDVAAPTPPRCEDDAMDDVRIDVVDDTAAGELLTVRRAAFVTEAQLYGDPNLPALTQTLAGLRAALP